MPNILLGSNMFHKYLYSFTVLNLNIFYTLTIWKGVKVEAKRRKNYILPLKTCQVSRLIPTIIF